MARTRQSPKKLTASHLSKIDGLRKRNPYKGEMAGFCAWHWLRMKSLSLGLSLQSKNLDPEQEAILARLTTEFRYYIGFDLEPEEWLEVHGTVPLFAQRLMSVFRLPDGQPHTFPNRVALSIDPSQDIKLVYDGVRKELLAEREKRNQRNAAGQGKPPAFSRMWIALQCYEKSKKSRNQSKKCWWANIGIKNENTAYQLNRLAKMMIEAATSGTWEQSFPLR